MTSRRSVNEKVEKILRQVKKDRKEAQRRKLVCDLCFLTAFLPCPSRRHWLCEDCHEIAKCGCRTSMLG